MPPTGSAIMPTITTLGMDSGMAGLAKGNQIIPCVSAALGERNFMVDFLSGNQHTFGLTQLTQRMLLDIAVADPLPGSAVSAAHFRVTVVFLIASVLLSLVFFAESSVCQLGAAGVGTGTLGLLRHFFTSFRDKKSHRWFTPTMALFMFTFLL